MNEILKRKFERLIGQGILKRSKQKDIFYPLAQYFLNRPFISYKYIHLIPRKDLNYLVNSTCIVNWENGTQKLNKTITSFKKIRATNKIDEISTCGKCKYSSRCHLAKKVPRTKLTSVGDLVLILYSIVDSYCYEKPEISKMKKEGFNFVNQFDEYENSYQEEYNLNGKEEPEKPSKLEKKKTKLLRCMSGLRIIDQIEWMLEYMKFDKTSSIEDIIECNQLSVREKYKADLLIAEIYDIDKKRFKI